jgi:hypothetical protein
MGEITTAPQATEAGITLTFEGREQTFVTQENADWVHEQLCRARSMGIEDTQRAMQKVLGLESWGGDTKAKSTGRLQ